LNTNFAGGKKVILGSGSPRRKELLQALRIPFTLRVVPTDETWPLELPLASIPCYLAKQKAIAQLHLLAHDELLITADTVVILEDTILNKPKDLEEAFAMLSNLSGKTHTVITGVCLSHKEGFHIFEVATQVTFNVLEPDEIDYYLTHYSPLDKAGAYGIQEWIGCVAMHHVSGSYNNVVGLPTDTLYHKLKQFQTLKWHYY
jgi:septum formation protein